MVQQKDMSANYNALAQGVFNPLKAEANVLAIKKARSDAAINELALESAPEKMKLEKARFELEQDSTAFTQRLQSVSKALSSDTPEEASKIYRALNPEAKDEEIPDFSYAGNDVSISYKNGISLKGPRWAMKEAANAISADPTWLTDPEKSKLTGAWFQARGISFEQKAVDPNVQAQIDAKAKEAEKDRTFKEKVTGADQAWRSKEAALDRAFKKGEGELDRTSREEIANAAKADKIPSYVKSAQDLIKSLKGKTSGGTSELLGVLIASMNKDKNFDMSQARSLEDQVPADLLPAYKKAVTILDAYYSSYTTKRGTYNPETGQIEYK